MTRMIVGALRIVFQIPESHSLKDKRQIVRSLLARVRNEFGVNSAEVGDQERWQIAELGFAMVSESNALVKNTLEKVADFIAETRPDVVILESQIETMQVGG